MIELKSLCAGYGKRPVISNINTVINTGEITSVIGPNGCGKSTLVETASGIITPLSGNVLMDGEDIYGMSPNKRAKRISLMPQRINAGALSVRSLVFHGRFPYLGYPRKYTDNDRKIVDWAMKTAGVYEISDKSMNEISGGQRQKAYIAMILAQDTDVVFMDEPLTFLDINYQLELVEIIKEMRRKGKTVILVMHDINIAMGFSDKIIAMKDGKIICSGTPKQIYDGNVIGNIFNIEVHYSELNGQYFFTKNRK